MHSFLQLEFISLLERIFWNKKAILSTYDYNERTDIVSQKFYGVAVFLHNTAKGKEGSGAFFSQ